MSWNARADLLERGFRPVENKSFERFERGDLVAYLAYDVLAPSVVMIRLDRKCGDQAYSATVLYPHWLDAAFTILPVLLDPLKALNLAVLWG